MSVNFLAAMVPADNPTALCEVLNWADENDFQIAVVNSALMPVKQTIAAPSQNGMGVKPMNLVYVKSSREDFKNYFGFDYDLDRLQDYPKLIAEKEGQ